MKKVLSIIALCAMTLSLSSFSTVNSSYNQVNCSQIAIETYDEVFEKTGSFSTASTAADAAFNSCERQLETLKKADQNN